MISNSPPRGTTPSRSRSQGCRRRWRESPWRFTARTAMPGGGAPWKITPGARDTTASSIEGVFAKLSFAMGEPRPSCAYSCSHRGFIPRRALNSSTRISPADTAGNTGDGKGWAGSTREQDRRCGAAASAVSRELAISGEAGSLGNRRRSRGSETNRTDSPTGGAAQCIRSLFHRNSGQRHAVVRTPTARRRLHDTSHLDRRAAPGPGGWCRSSETIGTRVPATGCLAVGEGPRSVDAPEADVRPPPGGEDLHGPGSGIRGASRRRRHAGHLLQRVRHRRPAPGRPRGAPGGRPPRLPLRLRREGDDRVRLGHGAVEHDGRSSHPRRHAPGRGGGGGSQHALRRAPGRRSLRRHHGRSQGGGGDQAGHDPGEEGRAPGAVGPAAPHRVLDRSGHRAAGALARGLRRRPTAAALPGGVRRVEARPEAPRLHLRPAEAKGRHPGRLPRSRERVPVRGPSMRVRNLVIAGLLASLAIPTTGLAVVVVRRRPAPVVAAVAVTATVVVVAAAASKPPPTPPPPPSAPPPPPVTSPLPIDSTTWVLPSGCLGVTVKGETLYQCGPSWLKKQQSDKGTWYLVVPPP